MIFFCHKQWLLYSFFVISAAGCPSEADQTKTIVGAGEPTDNFNTSSNSHTTTPYSSTSNTNIPPYVPPKGIVRQGIVPAPPKGIVPTETMENLPIEQSIEQWVDTALPAILSNKSFWDDAKRLVKTFHPDQIEAERAAYRNNCDVYKGLHDQTRKFLFKLLDDMRKYVASPDFRSGEVILLDQIKEYYSNIEEARRPEVPSTLAFWNVYFKITHKVNQPLGSLDPKKGVNRNLDSLLVQDINPRLNQSFGKLFQDMQSTLKQDPLTCNNLYDQLNKIDYGDILVKPLGFLELKELKEISDSMVKKYKQASTQLYQTFNDKLAQHFDGLLALNLNLGDENDITKMVQLISKACHIHANRKTHLVDVIDLEKLTTLTNAYIPCIYNLHKESMENPRDVWSKISKEERRFCWLVCVSAGIIHYYTGGENYCTGKKT